MTKTLIKRNPPTVNYPPMNELNLHGFSNVEYEGRQIMEGMVTQQGDTRMDRYEQRNSR